MWTLTPTKNAQARKPTYGTYSVFPHSATPLCSGLHGSHLPDLPPNRQRLDLVSTPPLCDGCHFFRRQRRQRPLVSIPSLLQPCRLGSRRPVHAPDEVGRARARSQGHLALGSGR